MSPELRPFSLEDAPVLKELVDQNRDYLREFLFWVDYSHTVEDAEEFIQTQTNEMTLALLCEERIVGVVGLRKHDRLNRSAKLGYWIAQNHQGKGLVTAAAKEMVRRGFEEWGLHRIEIRTQPNNAPSKGVVERLGAKKEGILRDSLYLNGAFVNQEVWSILANS